jgi:hypothetical protein
MAEQRGGQVEEHEPLRGQGEPGHPDLDRHGIRQGRGEAGTEEDEERRLPGPRPREAESAPMHQARGAHQHGKRGLVQEPQVDAGPVLDGPGEEHDDSERRETVREPPREGERDHDGRHDGGGQGPQAQRMLRGNGGAEREGGRTADESKRPDHGMQSHEPPC